MSRTLRDALIQLDTSSLPKDERIRPLKKKVLPKSSKEGAPKKVLTARTILEEESPKDEKPRFVPRPSGKTSSHPAYASQGHARPANYERSRDRDAEMMPHKRNFCATCKKVSPDVEFYRHSIRGLSANWLCCLCADKYKIPDSCRLTNQSDTANRKLFRREYGATKRYGFPTNPDLTPNYLLAQRKLIVKKTEE